MLATRCCLPTCAIACHVWAVAGGFIQRLVEYYKAGELSFENVVTFNMDEVRGSGGARGPMRCVLVRGPLL